MKLILSRKGFDSEYGGCASPIFEDGSMLSFPIPMPGASHRMRDAIDAGKVDPAGRDILADLTSRKSANNRRDANLPVHLDPYLRGGRTSNWRAALGQDGSAQGHLREESVGLGDMFLFFGWFRRVGMFNDSWRYVPGSPDLHVLFGWLQIGEVLEIEDGFTLDDEHRWLSDHPHWRDRQKMAKHNTIYIAADKLTLEGEDLSVSGGGTFDMFGKCLQLTAPAGARGRTDWQLPSWFHPSQDGKPSLSHHRKQWRWLQDRNSPSVTRLRSVAKGQEFVLDLEGTHKIDAVAWLKSLFAEAPLFAGNKLTDPLQD